MNDYPPIVIIISEDERKQDLVQQKNSLKAETVIFFYLIANPVARNIFTEQLTGDRVCHKCKDIEILANI